MSKNNFSVANSAIAFGKRLHVLDGIRGLAILSVICYHTLRVFGKNDIFFQGWRLFQESSWMGVDLFFVLSGFLITGILIDSKGLKGYFRKFYARRTLRIMPLYYVTLALVLILVPLVVGHSKLPELYLRLLDKQAWLWLYVQNFLQANGEHQLPGFGHFWSLAVEEQFYWFWPFVVFFFSRKTLIKICLTVCALEPILRAVMLAHGFSGWAVREYTFTRVDALLWGGLAALVIRDMDLLQRVWKYYKLLTVVALIVLAVLAAPRGFLLYESSSVVIFGYTALAISFSCLILYSCQYQTPLTTFIANRFFRWFGKYSYAIYIFHPFVLLAYKTIEKRIPFHGYLSAITCFTTVTLISCGIAIASWWILESRMLKLKHLFDYQKTTDEDLVSESKSC